MELAADPDEEATAAGREDESGGGEPGRGEDRPDSRVADELDAFRAARRRAIRDEYRSVQEPEPRRRRPVIGWMLFVLVVAGLVAGGWFGRDQIVAAVPQAADLYDMVGVPVDVASPALELRDVTRSQHLVDGRTRLLIEGRIVNTAASARDIPTIRATLYDATGNELAAWTFVAEEQRLEPGASAIFSTEREDPPADAREVSLTFDASEQ